MTVKSSLCLPSGRRAEAAGDQVDSALQTVSYFTHTLLFDLRPDEASGSVVCSTAFKTEFIDFWPPGGKKT